jgi:hypothetical protein
MVFKRADALRSITEGLARVQLTCKLQGGMKLFDNHTVAQHFFCRLLNSAYCLNLIEMDRIQANYPAIDLGDVDGGIAYQVTTERRGKKMQSTLDQFLAHGLDKQYDALKIFIIGDRQAAYKSLKVPPGLQFNPETDISGIPELRNHIAMLGTERLVAVQAVFDEELKGIGAEASLIIPKIEPLVIKARLVKVNLKAVEPDGTMSACIVLRARFQVTNQGKKAAHVWKIQCKLAHRNSRFAGVLSRHSSDF